MPRGAKCLIRLTKAQIKGCTPSVWLTPGTTQWQVSCSGPAGSHVLIVCISHSHGLEWSCIGWAQKGKKLVVNSNSLNDNVKVFTIHEPVYPELLYCDPVSRPNIPYGCSIVMFGSFGSTILTYSNTEAITRNIPSQTCRVVLLLSSFISQVQHSSDLAMLLR